MLRFGAKIGYFCPSFLLGNFSKKIGIAGLLLRLRPRQVEKFRGYQLTDVGEGDFNKKEKRKKKLTQNMVVKI